MNDPNLAWWNERAALHPSSPMYAPWIEQLRRGEPALFPTERRLAGDVSGQRLLHLQCHIGHDSLSWRLLGAEVTGVDFSEVALREADRLTRELGLTARWLHADVTRLPLDLTDFDLVVTTYGTTGWFADLTGWARGIAHALRPGGRFILVDAHPTLLALDDKSPEPIVVYPLHGSTLLELDSPGTYADEHAAPEHTRTREFAHGMGDIVGALVSEGLLVDHLAEHEGCMWKPHVDARWDAPTGLWHLPEGWPRLPSMWSLRAVKPG